MADVTPRSNQLNVNLAQMLSDAVTGSDNGVKSSADGSVFTSAQRNAKLSEGFTWVVNKIVQVVGLMEARTLLGDSLTTQAITFASGGTTVNADYLFPVALLKSDNNEFNLFPRKNLAQDLDPYLDAGYAIEGFKLYAYQRAAGTLSQLTSGTGTFYYLKADRKDTTTGSDIAANTVPDTTMDFKFLDAVMYYAASRLADDKGAGEWEVKAQKALAQALGLVGGEKIAG